MRRGCLIMRIVDLVKVVNAWVRQCFNLLRQEEMCKDSLDSLVKIFFFPNSRAAHHHWQGHIASIGWASEPLSFILRQSLWGEGAHTQKNTHPKTVTLTILRHVCITFLDRIYIFIYMECVWHVLDCSLECMLYGAHCLLVGT